ncbi:T9SS type A sorting domain-containing protein [Haliscomenobacter sp.]|uniref:T9SS type A sorting domain-containing protein n=1 Tax=Haliscomenobacter sp. TaxID=2717303 RepID=UPI003BABB92C
MKTSLPNALTVIALLLIPLLSFGQAPNLRASSSFAHFTAADNALISGSIEGTESLQDTCLIKGNSFICPGRPVQLCAPALADAYSWSNGDTTRCTYVSLPGTYSVTVTFVGGTVSTCSKTVTLTEETTCEITGNTAICQGQTTKLCAAVDGAVDYWWSTGEQTQCINVTAPGTYSLTVTTEGGCTSVCSKTVTLSPASCEITASNSSPCVGQSTDICVPTGALSYRWNTGATTNCITANTSGNYSVTVTYAAGCTSVCSKTVTIGQVATCLITGPDVICPGQTAKLCVPAGASDYWWITGAQTQCIDVTTAGTYSVTITDANGCKSECTKIVTLSGPDTCLITETVICPGQSTRLCVPLAGASDYWWITGAQTQCIDVTTSGTYSVTVTDANGCKSECTKIVTMGETANCQITETVICPGQTTKLCADLAGATDYWWITGAQTQCIDVTTAGTYSVTITDANGCKSECTKIVTMGETANCQITETVVCPGQTTKLCADLAGATDYWWITGAQTQCIDVTTAGTYSVTITDANGCKSECTKIVTMGEIANCQITETVICPGQTTKLCADLAGATDYWWITGAQTQCIDVTTAGTYSVTITDANGCKSECTKIVTMGETANCQITETVICPGKTTKLCADLAGASDYWWITGAQTQCIDVTTAGTYSVTITDANGCKSECTKIVTMGETANCQITGADVICPGQTTKLCADLAGASDYWWITGAQTQCIDVTTAGTYSITITDANGCKSECTKIVTMSEGATCVITGDEVISPGQSTQLCVASGALTYRWSTGATTNCITVNATGTYSVTVTYAGGCTSVCSKTIAMVSGINCIITGNDFICPGRLAQLCAPALAEAYLWSNGDTTRCTYVSAAGTYSVTVTYVGGMVRTCFKTIGVNENTTCEITGDTIFCPGKTTRLCAAVDGAIDYWWSTGEQTQCINVTAPGTYGLTITTEGGCMSFCSKTVTRCPDPINFTEKSIVEKQVNQSDGNIRVRIYPNPIYAKTMIEFQNTDSDADVLIDIYSSTGSKVATVFNGEVEKNVQYNTEWNGESLVGGIYYCRIVNGRQITYKKLILIKQ